MTSRGPRRREPDACEVLWCDENNEHTEHRHFAGTWVGTSRHRPVTVQVGMEANNRRQPQPFLAIVAYDTDLPTLSVGLDWSQVIQLEKTLSRLAQRHARGTSR